MLHSIDPTVDCVFKVLLGTEENKPLLVDFLNGVLGRTGDKAIVDVTLTNPYNLQAHNLDKGTIADVKARDAQGCSYQVEIQLTVTETLRHRMLYNWSHIYKDQIHRGDHYHKLEPTITIWLLTKNLFDADSYPAYHHHFQAVDPQHNLVLSDHFHIHVLELAKWKKEKLQASPDNWLYLFKEGKHIDADDPPAVLADFPIMEKAMSVLKEFSDQEKNYALYQSQLERELWENTLKFERDQALAREQQAMTEKQQAMTEKQQAIQQAAEREQQLLDMLKKHGINPDDETQSH